MTYPISFLASVRDVTKISVVFPISNISACISFLLGYSSWVYVSVMKVFCHATCPDTLCHQLAVTDSCLT